MNSGGDADSGSSSRDEEPRRPSLEDLAESIGDRHRRPRSEADESPEPDREKDREPDDSADEVSADGHTSDDDPAPATEPDDMGLDPSRTDAIIEVVGGRADSLLVLGPPAEPIEYDLCSRLISAQPEGTENLLLVTNTDPAEEHIAIYQGYLERFPDRTTILAVGDPGRSASSQTVSVGDDQTVGIESINDGTDLMRLGIVISKLTTDWDAAAGESVICFNSLTGLIEASMDDQAVFRFTHILLARLKSAGIHAHFHMDPGAHDGDTLDTFRELFDEVIEFDESGGVDLAG